MPTHLEAHHSRALGLAPDAGRPAVVLRGVTRRFSRPRAAPLTALDEITFTVGHGEIVAIVGPSGAGKTTLLELVCRLQEPDHGEVTADAAALMPQRDLLLPWLDTLDNAGLALRIAGRSRPAARREAAALLEVLGLAGFEQVRPDQLSGGMRQRVAFARTLLSGRPLLCLDEPFGALDAITRMELQSWLARALAREPRTVLLVTHDVEEAIVLADRLLILSPRPGRLVAEFRIDAPRPRSRTDPALVALRARVLEALR
ncbi:MAG TPA: ABC transporter ATP-binding protein [Solirubrobacteraceae bacterium]|nr:ABC transporter ATP-binding protein [Solirubrobacteraceae bacterium]